MNELFGCDFQVMDAQKGYCQTTKGLWIGRDALWNRTGELQRPVVIVDVEGLDSRERGDKRQTFENYFSLFAFALADCLIVNISCASLGCHTASGFGSLKVVLEASLELFLQEREYENLQPNIF